MLLTTEHAASDYGARRDGCGVCGWPSLSLHHGARHLPPAPAVKQQPFAAAESSKDLLVPGVRQAWAWSRRLGKEVLAAVGADRLMRLGAKPAWAQKARGASAWPPSVCSLPPAPPVAASISPGAVGPPFCHPREHRRMVALQFGEG